MVDRPMVIVDLGEMVDVVFISEELCPTFHLGGNDGSLNFSRFVGV
jgi:hypothetical protein